MRETCALENELADLRAKFSETQAVTPAEWRLTDTEERVFRVLLAVDNATRAAIATGASLGETRTIDVHIARIRSKTERFGVDIETVRSRGWRLVGRPAWRQSLAAQSAA